MCGCRSFHLVHRAVIERRLVGLPDLVPLDIQNFRLSLGPGYDTGYFAWPGLVDRQDDCIVKEEDLAEQTQRLQELTRNPGVSMEAFRHKLDGYHSGGHTAVGDCNKRLGIGPMTYSECSARDPTFWRLHKHLEELVVDTVHKILPM